MRSRDTQRSSPDVGETAPDSGAAAPGSVGWHPALALGSRDVSQMSSHASHVLKQGLPLVKPAGTSLSASGGQLGDGASAGVAFSHVDHDQLSAASTARRRPAGALAQPVDQRNPNHSANTWGPAARSGGSGALEHSGHENILDGLSTASQRQRMTDYNERRIAGDFGAIRKPKMPRLSLLDKFYWCFAGLFGSMQTLRGSLTDWSQRSFAGSVASFVDAVFRGFGQVVFQNSSICGVLCFVAILIDNPWAGLLAMVGTTANTLFALVARISTSEVCAGLFGFNGCLVGAMIGTFMHASWQSFLLVPFLCMLAFILQLALSTVGGLLDRTPMLTLGYNFAVATFVLFSLSCGAFRLESFGSGNVSGSVGAPIWRTDFTRGLVEHAGQRSDISFTSFFSAALRGVSQIFFLDNWISGLLVLGGTLVCSPLSAVTLLWGSIIGMTVAFICQAPGYAVFHGLWGYNGALGAMAVICFYVPTAGSALAATFAALFSTVMFGAMTVVFGVWLTPVFTIPYCTVAICFLAPHKAIRVLVWASDMLTARTQMWDAARFSTPEEHRQLYLHYEAKLPPVHAMFEKVHPAYLVSHASVVRPPTKDAIRRMQSAAPLLESDDILRLFEEFVLFFGDTRITREQMQQLYRRSFPMGEPEDLADLIFDAFDSDGSGFISIEEYLQAHALNEKGSQIDRLTWFFWLCDHEAVGEITRRSFERVLRSLMAATTDLGRAVRVPRVYIDDIFGTADSCNLAEFIKAIVVNSGNEQ